MNKVTTTVELESSRALWRHTVVDLLDRFGVVILAFLILLVIPLALLRI